MEGRAKAAYEIEVKTCSEDVNNPDGRTLTAVFTHAPLYVAECQQSEYGSYSVSATCSTTPTTNVTVAAGEGADTLCLPRSMTLAFSAPAPAAGYKFMRWWRLGEDGSKIDISTAMSCTYDLESASVTVGADFVPDAASLVVGNDSFVSWADAVTAAQGSADKRIALYDNYTFAVDATIPADVTLVVPSGRTMTVNENVSLTIEGTNLIVGVIQNNGSITGSGVLARNYSTVTQPSQINVPYPYGTDGVETGKGNAGVDGTAGKYVKSSAAKANHSASAFGSYSCQFHWFITVVSGDGSVLYSSTLQEEPLGVLCKVNRKKALNWIVSAGKPYADIAINANGAMSLSVYDYPGGGKAYYDNDNLFVLVRDWSPSNSSTKSIYVYGAFDCAGNSVQMSQNQYNGCAILRFFNGLARVSASNKIMGTHFMFYNCYTKNNVKSGATKLSGAYTTAAALYDSPDAEITWNSDSGSTPSWNIYGGGPYSLPSASFARVYGGTFKANNDPKDKLAYPKQFKSEKQSDGTFKVVKREPDPNQKPAKIGETEYATLQMAIDEATEGAKITLQANVELTTPLQIPEGANITLDLDGSYVTGECPIENSGTLEIVDDSGSVNPSEVSADIVNKSGNLYLATATFSGAITIEGGHCDLLSGYYNGDIFVDAQLDNPNECLELTFGKFAKTTYYHGNVERPVVGLAPKGYMRGSYPAYYIGKILQASAKGTSPSFVLTAFGTDADEKLYSKTKSSTKRSSFSSRAEWLRAMEIAAGTALFGVYQIDCTVGFDRYTARSSVSGTATMYGKTMTMSLQENAYAGTQYSVLLPAIRDTTMTTEKAPWKYDQFMPGGEHEELPLAVSTSEAGNRGTTCTLQLRYVTGVHWNNQGCRYNYDMSLSAVAAERRFVLGAGSNVAMIRPASGEATFYAGLSDAIGALAASGNDTVMLCNDCTDEIEISTPCKIDSNGFACSLVSGGGLAKKESMSANGTVVYEFGAQACSVTVEKPANGSIASVKVEGTDDPLELDADGVFAVPVGTTVVVAYVSEVEGYAFAAQTTTVTEDGTAIAAPAATAIAYTITYVNGGTSSNPTSYTIESGDITLVDPTLADHTFRGWYEDSTFVWNVKGVAIPAGSTGNKTFYAKWDRNPVQATVTAPANATIVSVKADGITLHAGADGQYTVPYGAELVITYAPNAGYEMTALTKTVSSYTGGEIVSPTVGAALTYSISCEDYDGTLPDGVSYPTSYDVTSADITLPTPTKADYVFGGWYEDKAFSKKAGEVTIPSGSTGDKTFYASWVSDETKVVSAVEVETTSGETEKIDILVPAQWKENVLSNEATEDEVTTELMKTADNGLKNWQNLVLNNATKAKAKTETQVTVDTSKPSEVDVQVTLNDKVKSVGVAKVATGADGATTIEKKVETTVTDDDGKARVTVDYSTLEPGVYQPTIVVESEGKMVEIPDPTADKIRVVKNEKKETLTVLDVPFSAAIGGQSVSVASVIDTSTLTKGDSIKVYNTTTGNFDAWNFNGTQWQPVPTYSTDSDPTTPVAASELKLTPGQAIILERSEESAVKPITMVGQKTDETFEKPMRQPESTDADPVWNLVPVSQDKSFDLNAIDAPNENDQVVVPSGNNSVPKIYTRKDDSAWTYTTNVVRTVTIGGKDRKVSSPVVVTNSTVEAGRWFWYVSGGGQQDTKIEWKDESDKKAK